MSSDIRAVALKGGAAVTPSDSVNDPAGGFAALEATTQAGLAKVTCVDGTTCTIYLALGIPVYLGVVRVWSGTTTATGIVGFYASAGVLP
jgi:hypothetical protein